MCYILQPRPAAFDARWTSAASTYNDDRESVASLPLSSIHGGSPANSSILSGGGGSSAATRCSVQIGNHIDLSRDAGVICGIATHQERILVLLYPARSIESLLSSGVPEEAEAGRERLPQILVLDVGEALSAAGCTQSELASILSGDEAFEEVSQEDVMMKLSSSVGCYGLGLGKNEFTHSLSNITPAVNKIISILASIPGEDSHFIFSRVDMIYAQAPSADDRIDWYLEQDLPQRALQIANENQNDLNRYSPKVCLQHHLDFKLIIKISFTILLLSNSAIGNDVPG